MHQIKPFNMKKILFAIILFSSCTASKNANIYFISESKTLLRLSSDSSILYIDSALKSKIKSIKSIN